jgi:hypothetical protein
MRPREAARGIGRLTCWCSRRTLADPGVTGRHQAKGADRILPERSQLLILWIILSLVKLAKLRIARSRGSEAAQALGELCSPASRAGRATRFL